MINFIIKYQNAASITFMYILNHSICTYMFLYNLTMMMKMCNP